MGEFFLLAWLFDRVRQHRLPVAARHRERSMAVPTRDQRHAGERTVRRDAAVILRCRARQ